MSTSTASQILAILPVDTQKDDDYVSTVIPILAEIIDNNHNHLIDDFIDDDSKDENGEPDDNRQTLIDAIESIYSGKGSDFTLDFDGAEYRIIPDSDIWEIYVEEIKNIIEDCYSDILNLDKIPAFIAVTIDYEDTARNAYVDGYGHTFSSYDGSEYKAGGHWIFRTN